MWLPIKFQKIKKDDISNVFFKTKVVIDITHPGQNGLTSRSLEALAAGAILLTNNENAVTLLEEYKDRIIVYDVDNISVKIRECQEIAIRSRLDIGLKYKLSLSRFVKELLD